MSSPTAAEATAVPPSTARRPAWRRWLTWVAITVLIAAFANLLGWDIRGWFSEVWDTIKSISTAALLGVLFFSFLQTTLTAFAWYSILKFAYPDGTHWRDIYAGYAVAVGLNTVLPANLGTFMMIVLFSVVVVGAKLAGVLGAMAVEKIYFTIAGGFVYLYLFLTVEGSFDIDFAWVHERPVATILLIASAALLIAMLMRRVWPHVLRWWDQAKDGGAILAEPRKYLLRVFLPSFLAWCSMLSVTAILLNAYGIPNDFSTLMHIVGGNSIANTASVTPGGAGVTQAFNVASLRNVTDPTTATAYSVANQLINTAWSISFAFVLMIWAWGWTGGRALVGDSLQQAKAKEAERREQKKQRKEEKEEKERIGAAS
jgi:uncharacterized membrane protein YbhN (UPF0104 family)